MSNNAFFTGLTVENNKTLTENGAVTYSSTLNSVLDFFYHAPAKRRQVEELNQLFFKALSENDKLATKALFYVRDIRGGQGERDTFRLGLSMLKKERPAIFKAVIKLVAEYGRWDDILTFVNDSDVQIAVLQQLTADNIAMNKGESISLLAKWMPSINTSSKETVALARKWAKVLVLSEKSYRQTLSALRSYLRIVEQKISANEWGKVDYSAVPSKANVQYKNAFLKHDQTRYSEFIEKAVKGEVKINSGTLYPSDIVHKYDTNTVDMSLEALWNQLPNYASSGKNALVVCDVSGSMYGQPIEVSTSLAIYIAERNQGIFHNKFITFSEVPELQTLVGNSLREKIVNLNNANWGMSTDLQAVFNLVLNAAVKHNAKQDELPEAIFIVSDMEFNYACRDITNFELIKQNFDLAGYVLPKLIFWNVTSRGMQTPVMQDENGVYLVSGYSPSIFEKAINAQACSPIEMMLEVLNNERYNKLDEVLASV